MPEQPPELTSRSFTTNSVQLHVMSCGDGPPVVLLHGFPEFWYSWRHQLPALVAAGFSAHAPDLRGYNASSQPAGVDAYRGNELVADVAGLIRQLGDGGAFVVGHDWGGVIAWRLAMVHPELVRRVAILNAPHPYHFRRFLATHPMQWLKSSYAGFFQLPYLPEHLISARDLALVERVFRRQPGRPDAFTPFDIEQYKGALRRGLTGPLNYYRAAMRYPADWFDPPHEVPVPTLVVWGMNDSYIDARVTEGFDRYVLDLEVVRLPGISHWVQNDAADDVNRLLVAKFA